MKLLWKNRYIDLGNDFLNMTQSACSTNPKTDIWVYIKTKFLYCKGNIQQSKETTYRIEKIFVNYTSDKG
jgi:capsule polysaccharide export protein KpsC/LpsZ